MALDAHPAEGRGPSKDRPWPCQGVSSDHHTGGHTRSTECRDAGPRGPWHQPTSAPRDSGWALVSPLPVVLWPLCIDGWLTSFPSLSDPISFCHFPEQLNPQGSHTGSSGSGCVRTRVAGSSHLPRNREKRARSRGWGGFGGPEVVRMWEKGKGLRQEEYQRGIFLPECQGTPLTKGHT